MLQVCSFMCFRGMLQVFHTNIANIDRNIAYVVMVIHICCKRISAIFHQFFQTYVASVFISMLHMFHKHVVCFIWILRMFAMVFKCFCKCLRHMFQVFHLPSDV
jgi:hypothetical protein